MLSSRWWGLPVKTTSMPPTSQRPITNPSHKTIRCARESVLKKKLFRERWIKQPFNLRKRQKSADQNGRKPPPVVG
jgi:hypothetical protein